MNKPANGALADIRVLELGGFISAPYAGKMLADMGADVVKVEPPAVGDSSRHHGPFPKDKPHLERSGLFLNLNTNKSGVTLDVGTQTGRDIFLALCEEVDVLIENRLPSEMQALGLDYNSIRKVNPQIVVTSVTAFGHTGPYKNYGGQAINMAAISGVASRLGDPNRAPLTMPLSRADYWGAINAAGATMTAIFARRRTGTGQHVDISTSECMSILINALNTMDYVDVGFYPGRTGSRINYIAYPWTLIPCKDGFMSLITIQDRHWDRFVELMGSPEWTKNPRYQDREAMGKEYPDEVDDLVKPLLADKTKTFLWEMCRKNRIPFQAVQTIKDVADCDHLKSREFFAEVDHPSAGKYEYPGAPYKFTKTPWRIRRPAPRLGEHNEAVLTGMLGLSRPDLATLRNSGVI